MPMHAARRTGHHKIAFRFASEAASAKSDVGTKLCISGWQRCWLVLRPCPTGSKVDFQKDMAPVLRASIASSAIIRAIRKPTWTLTSRKEVMQHKCSSPGKPDQSVSLQHHAKAA